MGGLESNMPRDEETTIKRGVEPANVPVPSEAQDQAPPPEGRDPSRYQRPTPQWWKRINWQLTVEIAVFVVGVIVACIYSKQLNQMIESNKINCKAFTTEAKAQVVVTNIRWIVNRYLKTPEPMYKTCSDSNGVEHICFELDFVNGGKGPALETNTIVHVLRPADTPRAQEIIDNGFSFPTMGDFRGSEPASAGAHEWNQSSLETICESGNCIKPIDAERMIDGDIPLYIYGVIQYRDMFKGEHATRFCYVRPAKKCPYPPGGCMTTCGFGNWFDREGDIPINRSSEESCTINNDR